MIINTTPDDMQYFTSDQMNAPQMMGSSNGDMLNVLDACLLTGWNSQQVQSAELADNIITLRFGTSHGFLNKQRITVTGFADSSLDGNYRATVVTPNSVTIMAPSALDVAGVLVAKIAPLGWESIFGSVDSLKRAYRSLSTKIDNRVLFLDMSYPNPSNYHATAPAKRAMLTVCEDMQVLGVPIGDMTIDANNKVTNPNGSLFWYQKRGGGSSTSASTAVPSNPSKWQIIGNGDFFYFVIGWSGYSQANNTVVSDVFGFGRFGDVTNGIAHDCFLMAIKNNNDMVDNPNYPGDLGSKSGSTVYTFNNSSQVEESVRSVFYRDTSSGSVTPYPGRYGSAVIATPYRIYTGDSLRGFLCSFMYLDSAVDATAYNGKIIDDLLIAAVSPPGNYESRYTNPVAFYIGS